LETGSRKDAEPAEKLLFGEGEWIADALARLAMTGDL